jgi:hypothetical protein
MRRAIPALPQYACMAWCSVEVTEITFPFNFYLYLYLETRHHASHSYKAKVNFVSVYSVLGSKQGDNSV